MVDLRDTEAAKTLVEMANGALEMTPKPSENNLASGKGKTELLIQLTEASSSSELNLRKRKHENESTQSQVEEELEKYTDGLADESMSVEKKTRTEEAVAGTSSSGCWINQEPSGSNSMNDPQAAIKPLKKQQSSGSDQFLFSIFHLLSAVRYALIHQQNVPSLTIHQILEIVRLNPRNPSVLETREPLLDLIRQWLKILSSEAAPVRADGWKPLVEYEKTSRSWSWIGPVPAEPSHGDHAKFIAKRHWGIPQITLTRLIKCFAKWLKRTQDTLQQIASLPPPPAELMQPFNSEGRLFGRRQSGGVCSINPSSEQVRNYFRREETLRYSIPDRAFSYTALDGRKSTVAPLIKSFQKSSRRVYANSMVKANRPPHLTIHSLVRDAAARLPGSVGTKADISVLLRDSQFIAEEISEAELPKIVAGALNRLRDGNDPCVMFDTHKNCWVYLHGEKEYEDF